MKKIFKMFFILPIFVLLAIFGLACEDNSLKSISIVQVNNISHGDEINSVPYVNGYYRLNKDDVFRVDVNCNPSSYSASDFEWSSSNTYCVVVSGNVLRAINVGNATITVSYRNSNGEVIKVKFDVDVNAYAPEITFRNVSNNIQYRGKNLLDPQINDGEYGETIKLTADQDEGSGYTYSYYDVNARRVTTEIINAGKYKITCTKDGTNISTTKEITVLPKTVNIAGEGYSYTYGGGENAWPAKLVNDSEKETAIAGVGASTKKGVGKDASADIVKYVEYVANDVNARSNVGSKPVYIYYQVGDDYKNNYTITTTNGNLNIVTRQIIILPKDQIDVTYGQNANLSASNYIIFSYETNNDGTWIGAEKNFGLNDNNQYTYKLDSSVVDYSYNFMVNSPDYYNAQIEGVGDNEVQTIGSVAELNDNNYLNVGSYFYKMNFTALNSNVRIANNLTEVTNHEDGTYLYKKISIKKREITVCPVANQSKVFLKNDPDSILYSIEKGNFVSGDSIGKFLFIDYKQEGIGNKNFRAKVGEYYYKIENPNTNYDITLSALAIFNSEAASGENDSKIKFTVEPLSIYVEFNNVNEMYKLPNDNGKQTISYVTKCIKVANEISSVAANYQTSIKLLKINNNTIITNGEIVVNSIFDDISISKSDFYENDGCFKFENLQDETFNSVFKFVIDLTPIELVNSVYAEAYFLSPGFYVTGFGENDYTYNSPERTTTLNLSKIEIKVYPNELSPTMSKVYDGTNVVPANFGVGLTTYSYDSLSVEELPLNIVLKKISSGNAFSVEGDSILSVDLVDGNAGTYRIVLNPDIECQENFAYYKFVLDYSKDYYFTITKCMLVLTPTEGQQKVYGANDPSELEFSVKGVPVDVSGLESSETYIGFGELASKGLVKEGKLARAAGENCGTYAINIGTLSFGNNYIIGLNGLVDFTVVPRKIQISPLSYTTIYGLNYPTEIAYNVETLDNTGTSAVNNNIYNGPNKNNDFSGSFSLGVYDEDLGDYIPIQKVGNYYLAGEYKIIQGTFGCTSNYEIVFVSNDFIVEQRQVTINFHSVSKTSSDVLSTTITNFPAENYEIENLASDIPRVEVNEVTLEATPSTYYVEKAEDIDISFYYGNVDITSSYQLKLGKRVVYTIGVTAIDLVLVNNTDNTNNIQTVTYNGKTRQSTYNEYGNPDFTLICQTPGYSVVQAETRFSFKYQYGVNIVNEVKNVGSYTVFLTMDDYSKIVVRNINRNENITFDKSDFEDQLLVDNHVLNVDSVAYLNITRANISYSLANLAFKSPMQYGTANLSDIKELTDGDEPIFKGVEISNGNYETITLKTEEHNFKLLDSVDSLRSLEVSERNPIAITIEADSGNYNPITATVYLKVVPKIVGYSNAAFNINADHSYVYSGTSKATSLDFTFDEIETSYLQNQYQITYYYKELQAEFNNSVNALITCTHGSSDTTTINDIKNLHIASFVDNSTNKIITNGLFSFPYDSNTNATPLNAGVYICFATCSLNSNYSFAFSGDVNSPFKRKEGNSLTFATIFEIKKMGLGNGTDGVLISNWVESFPYTTEFDFERPQTLPFEYNVYPVALQQKVTYVLDNSYNDLPKALPVGSYTIKLKIDDDNYYCEVSKQFSVTQLEAKIILPSIKTYVYTGSVINSFLQGIGVSLKNKDGLTTDTQYYYSDESAFIIEYFKVEDEVEIPFDENDQVKDVGVYKLKITYGIEFGTEGETPTNYYGTGEYDFSIISAPYTGTVTFKDSRLAYDPNYTAKTFFEAIINNSAVFNLETSEEYWLSLYYVTSASSIAIAKYENGEYTYDSNENFSSYFNVGQIKLRIIIDFVKESIEDYRKEAWLSIVQKTISDSGFLSYTTYLNTFIYNGYEAYQDLTLLPRATIEGNNGEWTGRLTVDNITSRITITYGGYLYYIEYNNSGKEYTIIDKLGHTIFTLKYIYYCLSADPSRPGEYQEINYFPISPNQYKIRYECNVGANYLNTFASFLQERTYVINKVNTLYVSFLPTIKLYDGTNSTNATDYYHTYMSTIADCNREGLVVSNDPNVSTTNMRYTIVRNDEHSYAETEGVCLKVSFNDAYSVKEVGKYKAQLTLLSNNSYEISKYFNNIKTVVYNSLGVEVECVYRVYARNATTIASDSFVKEKQGEKLIYRVIYESWLYIKFVASLENITKLVTFSSYTIDAQNNQIILSRSARIDNFVDGCDIELFDSNHVSAYTGYIPKGFSFASYSLGTYYLRFSGEYCESETEIQLVIQ